MAYYTDSLISFGTLPPIILAAPEAAVTRALQLAPNPSASGRFQLTGLEGQPATFTIFDPQGRRVLAGYLTGGAPELNLADLPAGLYLLRGAVAGHAFARRLVRE